MAALPTLAASKETYIVVMSDRVNGICPECQYAYMNGEHTQWFVYAETVEEALTWCHDHVAKNHPSD